jgi:ABC-type dipeptide/oligopeptide/nickel transport system ATPase component
MRDGRIVETAPATQLFDIPQHDYTRMLLAATLEDGPPRPGLTPVDARPVPVESQPLPTSGGLR